MHSYLSASLVPASSAGFFLAKGKHNMQQNSTHHANQTITITMNMVVQIVVLLAVVALVTWAVFLTNYPAAHDFFHELRHSLYVIPCH